MHLRFLHQRFLQVGIFGRVLKEVKIIIQELAEMLYKRMEDPHLELSQVVLLLLPMNSIFSASR